MRVGAKEKEKEMGGGQENSGNRARIVWDGESGSRLENKRGERASKGGYAATRWGRSISVLSPVCMAEGHGIDKVSRVHTPFPLLSRPRNYEFLSRRIRLRSK